MRAESVSAVFKHTQTTRPANAPVSRLRAAPASGVLAAVYTEHTQASQGGTYLPTTPCFVKPTVSSELLWEEQKGAN